MEGCRPFEPGDWRLYDDQGHTTGYELDGTFQVKTEPVDAAGQIMWAQGAKAGPQRSRLSGPAMPLRSDH